MCGIHGILNLTATSPLDPSLAERMGQVAVHRGPDDSGLYAEPGLLLGMRRLSIIDVAGGHQPLHSADGSIQLVCNGEIYNFRELRRALEARGHRFATGSDCEVLVHAYRESGDAMVRQLDGMFGFALWDAPNRRLVIGRDRLGIKPVYWCVDDGRLLFASEIKSLLAVRSRRPELDAGSLEELLYLGYVTAPRTMFQGIRKLLPGHLLVAQGGVVREEPFWDPAAAGTPIRDPDEAAEALRATLRDSVRQQMVADVPLGAFLSGGIDSSAVVAMMAGAGAGPTRTYAIGFDMGRAGAYYNELPDAARVARHFGTKHQEIIVRPDVARLLPSLLWHMDEPIADSAIITTFLVAQFARREVTVILSGVGGDELLGGYRRYLGPHYTRHFELLPRWLRTGVLQPAARLLPSDRHGPVTNLLRYAREFIAHSAMPPEEQYAAYVRLFDAESRARLLRRPVAGFRDPVAAAFGRFQGGDFVNRLMSVDLVTQLPDDLLLLTDKTTMATSLECRVPLLSNAMVDLASRLPSSLKIRGAGLKHLFKESLRGVLPDETLTKSKRGFGAPMGAWLKRELRPLMDVTLSRDVIDRRGLFDADVIAESIALHEASRRDFSDHLQCLMNLEIWMRLFLDGQSVDDISTELAERTRPAVAA